MSVLCALHPTSQHRLETQVNNYLRDNHEFGALSRMMCLQEQKTVCKGPQSEPLIRMKKCKYLRILKILTSVAAGAAHPHRLQEKLFSKKLSSLCTTLIREHMLCIYIRD